MKKNLLFEIHISEIRHRSYGDYPPDNLRTGKEVSEIDTKEDTETENRPLKEQELPSFPFGGMEEGKFHETEYKG